MRLCKIISQKNLGTKNLIFLYLIEIGEIKICFGEFIILYGVLSMAFEVDSIPLLVNF